MSKKGLDNTPLPPYGWSIEYNPKPIPNRSFDWDFWHDDYDGADGSNGLAGNAQSRDDALKQIAEIEDDLHRCSALNEAGYLRFSA